MDGWQERLVVERAELAERLGKLNAFIATGPDITAEQLSLLCRQAQMMTGYLGILDERVHNEQRK